MTPAFDINATIQTIATVIIALFSLIGVAIGAYAAIRLKTTSSLHTDVKGAKYEAHEAKAQAIGARGDVEVVKAIVNGRMNEMMQVSRELGIREGIEQERARRRAEDDDR